MEAIEGGTARHLRYVVGHVPVEHVVVVPPERSFGLTDTDAYEVMRAAGARVELVPMTRSLVSSDNLLALARIRSLIKRWKPDVVHGHSSIGAALARMAAATTGTPTVYTPNGLFPWLSAMAVERALGRVTDVFVASSPSEAQLVQQLRLVPRERMVVVPNGIEMDPAPPTSIDVRKELGVSPDTPIVGSVARLVPQKAPEVYVRACGIIAARDPDVHFVLVGEGPLDKMVENEILRAGIEDRFLLIQHCNEGPSLIGQFDVFALSSRYEAGAAFAPMEAMRAGTPMVLTDVIGNHDAIDDGRSGLFVEPEDPSSLAEAVLSLLDDPARRQSIALEARRRLEERFDVAVISSRLLDVYELAARREPLGPAAAPLERRHEVRPRRSALRLRAS
ncbi:MAG: glycosyltransferase [Acidimicrobiia bacterium]|nr:glycosyltransferase [Acidimicrobiia bacterium]